MTSQNTNQHMIWSKLPFNRFLWFLMIIILINDYKMKKHYRVESFPMFYTQCTFKLHIKLHMKTISNLTVHWDCTVWFHQLWQFEAMKEDVWGFFEMHYQGGGISGHFFPEDPSAEVFGPVGGRAKCREYAPHSMLTCKGRWWPEQNYKQWM